VYIPKGILEKNKKGCLVFFRKAQTTKAFHLKLENTYQDKTIGRMESKNHPFLWESTGRNEVVEVNKRNWF
jgi:hypothetical protein